MKVLITGANGQLGKDLVKLMSQVHEVFGFGREELDVSESEKCIDTIRKIRPDAIIHLAAYTAVDRAEIEEDRAYQVNAIGSRNVAVAAQEIGAKLCYVSTDYVFDGTSSSPYKEYDATNPISVYGKSKRAGELLVSSLCTTYFIVRTAWVYGKHGNNFVKTMLSLANEQQTIKVVNDQIGSPTYTVDLAKFIVELIDTRKYGIYHATNTGTCSWYEFAKEIFKFSGMDVQVEPCTTDEFPRLAKRPKNSVLDHMSIRVNGLTDLRHWKEALFEYINASGSDPIQL